MPKLKPVNWSEFVKGLKQLGFQGPFPGGKHPYMERNGIFITIPNPHRADIGPEYLSRLLKQAGVSREEWLKKL